VKILLAIDDDASRYAHIARRLSKHEVVVSCVQSPDAAEILLQTAPVFAVMLDHDMPEWDGKYYAREVFAHRNVPICISSANHAGASEISKILNDFAVPHTVISVTETAVEERWMGWVLDTLYKKDEVSAQSETQLMFNALKEIELICEDYPGELTIFELGRDPNYVVNLVKNALLRSDNDES
jgi:CheY-like chemotaxis protein